MLESLEVPMNPIRVDSIAHYSHVEEHNPYLSPSTYPEEALSPPSEPVSAQRAISWEAEHPTEERYVPQIQELLSSEEQTTKGTAFPEVMSPWKRVEPAGWRVWSRTWLEGVTHKQRGVLFAVLLLLCSVSAWVALHSLSGPSSLEKPKAALSLVNSRLQALELRQNELPRVNKHHIQRWLKQVKRDRVERKFLLKFQGLLVERMLQQAGNTKRKRILFELMSSRFVLLEQNEEKTYEQLQRLTRHATGQRYLKQQTRRLLRRIRRDKEERRFLRKLQSLLFSN